jgi:hypothetical protein
MRPIIAVALAVSLAFPAARGDDQAAASAADAFVGLGLEGFAGEASIAAALRRAGAAPADRAAGQLLPGLELRGLSVAGPSDRDANAPIAAELRSRLDRLDLAAGDPAREDAVIEGPSQWIGRIGLANERPDGSERLEVRTTLGRRVDGGVLGIEVGPRLERRLRRGATFFIDGTAEARAARWAEDDWWTTSAFAADGTGVVGLGARTGVVR